MSAALLDAYLESLAQYKMSQAIYPQTHGTKILVFIE